MLQRVARMKVLVPCCFIAFAVPLTAQETTVADLRDEGFLALYQALTDLKSGFILMSVAAHPDDEDIETLTYYRRHAGVHTVVVAATRGEGGQNEIGPELYRELGVIRTYEMRRAGAISGATYYNLNLEEFGYSKSAEETLAKWGREEPLRHLVYLIRKLRPEVIITNHDTVSGHGHHQALGRLIREAFTLAADPQAFPEQLSGGLTPWQPRRLFQRLWTPDSAEVAVRVGEFDAIRGVSYTELAADALSQHRSQGMELFAARIKRGLRFTYYKLIKSVGPPLANDADLFAGLPDVFDRLRGRIVPAELTTLEQARERTLASLHAPPAERRAALIEELRLWRNLATNADTAVANLISNEQSLLEKALAHALVLDLGLHISDQRVVRGQKLTVQGILFNGGDAPVTFASAHLQPRQDWFGPNLKPMQSPSAEILPYNHADTLSFTVRIPRAAPFTVPKTEVFYQTYRWRPLLRATAACRYEDVTFTMNATADFDIVPDLTLEINPERRLIPVQFAGTPEPFIVHLQNNLPRSVAGQLRLQWSHGPQDNAIHLEESFSLAREDEETAVRFDVNLPAPLPVGDHRLRAEAVFEGDTVRSLGLVRVADVKTVPGLNVGIVQSYDNTLQHALEQLRIDHQLITTEDLRWRDLSRFDTILLDIRAYLVREDLRQNNARVLEYVENGGNLVVMYHKVYEWNPDYGNPQWAPYPLILSRKRVTHEAAPVQILEPAHSLLNEPNAIGEADWHGWIQERGLYFPDRWDAHYTPLLAMSDPGEPELRGAYLVAEYGLGTYIYTSLVWYRQLRALVPGAFRHLANMIALPRTRR